MKELENPMVLDSLWDEIDEIEREEERAAWWYEKADEDHDEWVAMRGR